jgi:hypothetical protein
MALELVVQRAVHDSGKVSDQATFTIDLPQGAVATRLHARHRSAGFDEENAQFRVEL